MENSLEQGYLKEDFISYKNKSLSLEDRRIARFVLLLEVLNRTSKADKISTNQSNLQCSNKGTKPFLMPHQRAFFM